MANQDYEEIIGLEVHAELSTKTKIFCSCPTEFGADPNTHVCPVCMAMPGALPVLNEKVVEYAVKAGLATNCSISQDSKNDRKNYFYPDLPKSYQISQFDKPLCNNGYIEIEDDNGNPKKVRILRIHIEEDAGKLNHNEFTGGSLVDLNRAGVPLIEIVSEPDLRSSGEADRYLKKLKSILQYIEVSDCKMQEGSLRADVNVSVHKKDEPFGTICEMKNMNSFKSIQRAIEYEKERQINELEHGRTIIQETRRWDDIEGQTFEMRDKEDAQDYRYFPEPDLVAIGVDAGGNIIRINNCLENIARDISLEREKLDNTKLQLENAKVESQKEFPQEQELKDKQRKLDSINAELKINDDDHEILGDEQEELIRNLDSEELKIKSNEEWIRKFEKNMHIDKLDNIIINELIEDIQVHDNGNINIIFKYQDEFIEAIDFIKREKYDIMLKNVV